LGEKEDGGVSLPAAGVRGKEKGAYLSASPMLSRKEVITRGGGGAAPAKLSFGAKEGKGKRKRNLLAEREWHRKKGKRSRLGLFAQPRRKEGGKKRETLFV